MSATLFGAEFSAGNSIGVTYTIQARHRTARHTTMEVQYKGVSYTITPFIQHRVHARYSSRETQFRRDTVHARHSSRETFDARALSFLSPQPHNEALTQASSSAGSVDGGGRLENSMLCYIS